MANVNRVSEDQVRNTVVDLFLNGDRSYPLAADVDLLEEGICDSLALVRLAAALEKLAPGVRIFDQDINRENLGSIGGIVRYLNARA